MSAADPTPPRADDQERETLKSCPFCGTTPILSRPHTGVSMVYCPAFNVGCLCPSTGWCDDKDEDAPTRWNRRIAPEPVREAHDKDTHYIAREALLILQHARAWGLGSRGFDARTCWDLTDRADALLKHAGAAAFPGAGMTPAQPEPQQQGGEGKHESLTRDLASTLNRHSAENGSDTPDFILAEFLMGCLGAFNLTTSKRADWYGHKPPGALAAPAPAAPAGVTPDMVNAALDEFYGGGWREHSDSPDTRARFAVMRAALAAALAAAGKG